MPDAGPPLGFVVTQAGMGLLLGVVATAVDGSAPEEAPEDSAVPFAPAGPAPADHPAAASESTQDGPTRD